MMDEKKQDLREINNIYSYKLFNFLFIGTFVHKYIYYYSFLDELHFIYKKQFATKMEDYNTEAQKSYSDKTK